MGPTPYLETNNHLIRTTLFNVPRHPSDEIFTKGAQFMRRSQCAAYTPGHVSLGALPFGHSPKRGRVPRYACFGSDWNPNLKRSTLINDSFA